ncbi:MAG: TolC family protein [Vicinamibacterales bacterium]
MRVVLTVAPLVVCLLGASPVRAQGPSSSGGTPSRQIAAPGSSSPFLGGVPQGTATADAIPITILDAIDRALERNLGLLNAEQDVRHAEGSRWTALADLLPNVSGRLSENRQRINLAAFGFPLPPGTPALVGPFNVFDARVNLSQPVFDLRALNEARAEGHNVAAARHSVKSARDLVVLVAANLYLQGLASAARLDSARAQVDTAQALYQQATDMKTSGLVAGIEVLRAEVQLSTQRQRVTASQNELEKTKLLLARVMGLPAGQAFTLSDELPFVPPPDMTLEEALSRAFRSRPDFLAAQERLEAAEAERRAAVGELLPSVRVNADYGKIGLTPGTAESTYALAGVLNIPIFNGGRTRGRLLQADADMRTRRSEVEDLRAGIDVEVRSAFLDLQASREQLEVATRARELAGEQLRQSRDRFAGGVASNIEVVQSQEAVALASEQYIAALYGFNIAKAMLARDLGMAEEGARQFIGGVR